jgi:periplasmic divalent cation tolerance protein
MTAADAPARLCDPLPPGPSMSVLLVLCSCPDAASADALAGSLVEQRLAACVNVLPGMRSTYRWEGRVERADEILMLIKTTTERFDALRNHLVGAHPHALPEVLAFEAAGGLDRYLDWVRAETTSPGVPA